jgi:vacuolar protein sorting-associated protein 26
MFFDRGNHYEFLSLVQELAAPGELQHPQTYDFNFKNVEKQYESYNGINVKLRYFVRVTVSRRMADVIREKDIWVYSYRIPPEMNSSIKMDVGIEDCLHIEFEYSKSKYHLKDVIVGRIYFLLVRLKIKHMELSIIRRETTGAAPNQYNESETLVRFEVSVAAGRAFPDGAIERVAHAGNANRVMFGTDHGRLAIKRRDHPNPTFPGRLRPDPNIPRR